MTEGERAKKRSQRGGRQHTMAPHKTGAARAQQVAVVDRVGAKLRRVAERQHLPPRPGSARTIAEIDGFIDRLLDPEPPRQRRRQQQARVRNRALVIKTDPQAVQHNARPIVHHMSGLLTQAAAALYSHFLPAQEVILSQLPDGTDHATRWIEAQSSADTSGRPSIDKGQNALDSWRVRPIRSARSSPPVVRERDRAASVSHRVRRSARLA
jgi:hypothetical protein